MEDLWHRRRLNLSGRYSAHNLSNNVVFRIRAYFTKWKENFKLGHKRHIKHIRHKRVVPSFVVLTLFVPFVVFVPFVALFRGRVAGQQCSTNGGTVEAEFGGDDLRCLKTRLKCSAFYFANDWVKDE